MSKKNSTPIRSGDIRSATCECCGKPFTDDHPMRIMGRCHPDSPTIAEFIPSKRAMRFACATCDAFICYVKVAHGSHGSNRKHGGRPIRRRNPKKGLDV